MKTFMSALLLLAVVLAPGIGCKGEDDGIDHSAVKAANSPLKAAAQRAGGDWEKLTPDEQKLFLDRAQGNEKSAKMLVGMFSGGAPAGPHKGN
jgi:hypothetical protein